MGIAGADPRRAGRILDRMLAHLAPIGDLEATRHELDGLAVLHLHHGAGVVRRTARSMRSRRWALVEGELYAVEGGDDADAAGVLRLYEDEGTEGLGRLNGSYSVLVYEEDSRRLTLAVDRYFSRPLYYWPAGDALLFSSRLNPLAACGEASGLRLDMTALAQFLTFQHVQSTSTWFRSIKALLPGSALHFGNGRVHLERYWKPRYRPEDGSEREHVERLTSVLERVGARATSDERARGLMLSGGLDSRVVPAVARRPMTAFTAGDFLNREVRTARRVAHARGWRHVFLRRSPGHYARVLGDAVELSDGMARFDHCHFLGQLAPVAWDCDVLFNEVLMDEVLKGYYWRRVAQVGGLSLPLPGAKNPDTRPIEEQILGLACKSIHPARPWRVLREPWRSRYHEIIRATIRAQLADADTDNPYHLLEHFGGFHSLGRAGSFLNMTCVRPWLEFRSLCLDSELLEAALRIPVRFRMGGRVLRQALRRLAPRLYSIPTANTGLRLDCPEPLGWAMQMGTAAWVRVCRRLGGLPPWATNESWPDRAVLLREPPLRLVLEETLTDEGCFPPDIFDGDALKRLMREHVSGRGNRTRLLLCLLTFGTWFRRYGPSDI